MWRLNHQRVTTGTRCNPCRQLTQDTSHRKWIEHSKFCWSAQHIACTCFPERRMDSDKAWPAAARYHVRDSRLGKAERQNQRTKPKSSATAMMSPRWLLLTACTAVPPATFGTRPVTAQPCVQVQVCHGDPRSKSKSCMTWY